MANNNEPLLHFGEDNETNNNNSTNSNTSNGHIVFNDFANDEEKNKQEETATRPAEQPKPQPKPQPQPQRQTPKPRTEPARSVTPPSFGKKNLQINLIVVNAAGVVLPRYTVNKQEVESGRNLTFQEERETYDLVIAANGYKEKRIQVTQQDLIKGEKRVSLIAQLQSLIVAINTPDGIKRGSIEIDQNNAIYQYIKDASHTDTPLNEMVIGGVGHTGNNPSGKISPWPYIIALAVGLLLGIGVSSMFNCSGDEKTDEQTELVEGAENTDNQGEDMTDEVNDQPTLNTEETPVVDNIAEVKEEEKKEEEKKEEPAAQEEEKKEETTTNATMAEADVKYLKEKDTWNRNQATSEEAKRFLAAFSAGNIETIIGSNAYNSLPKEKRNGYYNKLVDDLNKIKKQSNYNDAKTALRDLCKDGKINLVAVQDKMHRMLK